MKVVIAYPPLKFKKGYPLLSQNRQFQWFTNRTVLYPPVTASAATLLKYEGNKVFFKDSLAEGESIEEFMRFLISEKPDLIAVETKTPVINQHWELYEEIKFILPDTKLALMGDHITALPEESFYKCKALDFAITGGDYDFMLSALVKALEGKNELPKGLWYRDDGEIKNTGKFETMGNLDDLPFIDRDLTKWWLYEEHNIKGHPFTYTMAGRDCPWGRCTFCSWTTIYPQFRVRTVDNFLDEIGILIEKYGIKEVFDDTGTFPAGSWLEEFCEKMRVRGYNQKVYFSCNFRFDWINQKRAILMKKAGFRLLKLGLESANQHTLDRLNKNTRVEQLEQGCRYAKEAGLEVHLTIMVGFPWETKKDALNTLSLAKKLMSKGWADLLQSTIIIPYPGTPLFKEALENDWFRIDPYDYPRYDMREPILKTPDMSPEEVVAICNSIYRTFLTPGFIWHHLRSVKSFKDIRYLIKGAKAVVGHLLDFRKTGKSSH